MLETARIRAMTVNDHQVSISMLHASENELNRPSSAPLEMQYFVGQGLQLLDFPISWGNSSNSLTHAYGRAFFDPAFSGNGSSARSDHVSFVS